MQRCIDPLVSLFLQTNSVYDLRFRIGCHWRCVLDRTMHEWAWSTLPEVHLLLLLLRLLLLASVVDFTHLADTSAPTESGKMVLFLTGPTFLAVKWAFLKPLP